MPVSIAVFAFRCVPFRAGQLNSTTFDLRMFDQLLLLLLLLPGRRHRVCERLRLLYERAQGTQIMLNECLPLFIVKIVIGFFVIF